MDADSASAGPNLLADVMEDFNAARKYVKEHYEKVWEDCFKSYNGIRTRRGYEGDSDEFVPETFSIVESLKASIAGAKPKIKYIPIVKEQESDTSALNALVDFYWKMNNMTEKILNWVGDMIIYGNGVFYVTWQDEMPVIQHIHLP